MSALAFEGLRVHAGPRRVVDGGALALEAGGTAALVGPLGAYHTTTYDGLGRGVSLVGFCFVLFFSLGETAARSGISLCFIHQVSRFSAARVPILFARAAGNSSDLKRRSGARCARRVAQASRIAGNARETRKVPLVWLAELTR